MSFKTIINLFVKLGKWIKNNIVPLVIGGVVSGTTVAVVSQEQKKKAVEESFKRGCEMTAKAYEEKLNEQAKRFFLERKLVQQEFEQYEQLMRAYEEEIARLEMLEEQSKEEKEVLRLLLKQRGKLLKLRNAV